MCNNSKKNIIYSNQKLTELLTVKKMDNRFSSDSGI